MAVCPLHPATAANVVFDRHGRDGRVVYRERHGAIHGNFEFGGGDVVAIVSMGSTEAWQQRHAWALPRRVPILRAVADEAIRHWAPRCAAEINEETGEVLLRLASPGVLS